MDTERTPQIYLIPGLGGTRKLFDKLKDEGLNFNVIEFLKPFADESLVAYAKRMTDGIDQTKPFILGGVSFGGIITCEACTFLKPEKVILISSVKSSHEFPNWPKTFRKIPLHKLVPIRHLDTLFRFRPFPRDKDQRRILLEMIKESDPDFFRWALNQAVHWENAIPPSMDILHLHGSHDALFPARRLKNAEIIQGGTHGMVLSHAKVIAEKIKVFLGEKKSVLN